MAHAWRAPSQTDGIDGAVAVRIVDLVAGAGRIDGDSVCASPMATGDSTIMAINKQERTGEASASMPIHGTAVGREKGVGALRGLAECGIPWLGSVHQGEKLEQSLLEPRSKSRKLATEKIGRLHPLREGVNRGPVQDIQ